MNLCLRHIYYLKSYITMNLYLRYIYIYIYIYYLKSNMSMKLYLRYILLIPAIPYNVSIKKYLQKAVLWPNMLK